jgi:hypothetical protein
MTIILSFTQEQLAIINASLMEIPYKHAAPLIADINAQIQKQFDAKADQTQTGSIPQTVDDSPNNF